MSKDQNNIEEFHSNIEAFMEKERRQQDDFDVWAQNSNEIAEACFEDVLRRAVAEGMENVYDYETAKTMSDRNNQLDPFSDTYRTTSFLQQISHIKSYAIEAEQELGKPLSFNEGGAVFLRDEAVTELLASTEFANEEKQQLMIFTNKYLQFIVEPVEVPLDETAITAIAAQKKLELDVEQKELSRDLRTLCHAKEFASLCLIKLFGHRDDTQAFAESVARLCKSTFDQKPTIALELFDIIKKGTGPLEELLLSEALKAETNKILDTEFNANEVIEHVSDMQYAFGIEIFMNRLFTANVTLSTYIEYLHYPVLRKVFRGLLAEALVHYWVSSSSND